MRALKQLVDRGYLAQIRFSQVFSLPVLIWLFPLSTGTIFQSLFEWPENSKTIIRFYTNFQTCQEFYAPGFTTCKRDFLP